MMNSRSKDIPNERYDILTQPALNSDNQPINDSIRCQPIVYNSKTAKCIGVNGIWYDVTNFVSLHPGGNIIMEYFGQDATSTFFMYHTVEDLNRVKKSSTYNMKLVNPISCSPIEQDYRELQVLFRKLGYFDADLKWFIRQLFSVSLIFTTLWTLVFYGKKNRFCFFLGGLFLGIFWQQCGFLMHDAEHNQIFQNRKIDQLWGSFFGGFCAGFPGKWWRDEHSEHHLFTATYIENKGPCDPQIQEKIWILGLESGYIQLKQNPIMRYFVQIQHWIFLPITFMLGRFGILLDSYLHISSDILQITSVILHWTWVISLLMSFESYRKAILFYIIGSFYFGSLSLQLVLSHYSMPQTEKESVKITSVFNRQVEVTIDINNYIWMDWYWGGLNKHLAHHLFPRMHRQHLRMATEEIKKLCIKHGLKYHELTAFQALKKTLYHFYKLSQTNISFD